MAVFSDFVPTRRTSKLPRISSHRLRNSNDSKQHNPLINRVHPHCVADALCSCRAYAVILPAFLAAFTRGRKLNAREVAQLKELIDSYEEE